MTSYLKQAGFTLIEMVITVALIGILATFAAPSYFQMIRNTQIRSTTDSIVSGLQMARAEAVKRNADVQFDFRSGSAWTVCIPPAGGGGCPAGNNIASRSSVDGGSADVTVNVGQASPYVFGALGLVQNGGFNINIDHTINAGSNRNLRIVIGAGGLIKSCDPALSPTGTDPRRC